MRLRPVLRGQDVRVRSRLQRYHWQVANRTKLPTRVSPCGCSLICRHVTCRCLAPSVHTLDSNVSSSDNKHTRSCYYAHFHNCLSSSSCSSNMEVSPVGPASRPLSHSLSAARPYFSDCRHHCSHSLPHTSTLPRCSACSAARPLYVASVTMTHTWLWRGAGRKCGYQPTRDYTSGRYLLTSASGAKYCSASL